MTATRGELLSRFPHGRGHFMPTLGAHVLMLSRDEGLLADFARPGNAEDVVVDAVDPVLQRFITGCHLVREPVANLHEQSHLEPPARPQWVEETLTRIEDEAALRFASVTGTESK